MNGSKLAIFGSLISGVVLGLVIVRFLLQTPQLAQRPITPPVEVSPIPTVEPAPTPLPPNTDVSWMSPEGKKTLIMKTVDTPEGAHTYSFFVSDTGAGIGQLVFTKSVPPDSTMAIPFNSWSPGNQFFFIQEHDGEIVENFVLKSTGTTFANAAASLDVNQLFSEKNDTFTFGEATGWASPTLLIVNTKTSENEQGPTFWLDVNRLTFTRLSTKF